METLDLPTQFMREITGERGGGRGGGEEEDVKMVAEQSRSSKVFSLTIQGMGESCQ